MVQSNPNPGQPQPTPQPQPQPEPAPQPGQPPRQPNERPRPGQQNEPERQELRTVTGQAWEPPPPPTLVEREAIARGEYDPVAPTAEGRIKRRAMEGQSGSEYATR